MAARMRARRGSVERQRPHHAVEHVEVVDQRLGVGVDEDELGPVEPVQQLVTGGRRASPAVSARNCGIIGFDAASTTSSTGPGSLGTGTAWRRGWMPCTGRPLASRTRPSHWKPGESSRKPRSSSASTRRPDHAAGHLAGEAEPRRAPRRTPALTDGERRQVVERRPGLDGQREALGVDERQHPLGDLPGDPLLDQLAVVVHRAILVAGQLRALTAGSQVG